ncbi:MAG TPA: glycosyltransferase family 2 protein [Thermoanaerobaculia bacterium]|nr:glycosyltransferase family 2 protein [Thermoanaerobaculia bacterium]
MRVDVVIPAFNEERVVGDVVASVPRPPVDRVVVADNNSRDRTAAVAAAAGAIVVPARRQGYGSACLAGLAWLRVHESPDVVVFLDADGSDFADELPLLLAPIVAGEADLVIGSRVLGRREPGALLPQARAGNLVACALIALLYRHRYTDLGPFRAVRWEALERLEMRDPDFGWTAEISEGAPARVAGRRSAGVVSAARGRVEDHRYLLGHAARRAQDPVDGAAPREIAADGVVSLASFRLVAEDSAAPGAPTGGGRSAR